MDWELIKNEYVTTDVTQRELAKKYKVSKNSISIHCVKEGWAELRKKHLDTVRRKVGREMAEKQAGEQVNILKSLINASNNAMKLIEINLQRALENEEPDPRKVKDWVACIKDLAPTVRNLNDLDTLHERETRKIALERLELERKKANLDQEFDNEIIINFGSEESYGE